MEKKTVTIFEVKPGRVWKGLQFYDVDTVEGLAADTKYKDFKVGHKYEVGVQGRDVNGVTKYEIFYPFQEEAPKAPARMPEDPASPEGKKEYRPDKDLLIVRQSSLKAAVDLAIARGETDPDQVLDLADALVDWVTKSVIK